MSRIHRFTGSYQSNNYAWDGVLPEIITTEDVHGIIKHVLVGPEDGAPNFVIRYFQVPPSEQTFFHTHAHEHGMVILHGKAKIQVKQEVFDLAPLDAIFVSGGDLHRVINTGEESLGFLCIIPRVDE